MEEDGNTLHILEHWEAELLGLDHRTLKKPVAKPAFDPFQEIEVKDSRHLFTPKRTKRKRKSYTLSELLDDQGPLGDPREPDNEVHLRGYHCETEDPVFYWSDDPSEVTCFFCARHGDDDR